MLLNQQFGFFFSRNYGKGRYQPRDHCEWSIITNKSNYIHLNITNFSTEKNFDVFTIYEGWW